MALLKPAPLTANPDWSANYHRIEQAAYDRRAKVLELVIGIYPSELHAQNELPPIETRVVRVSGDEADLPLTALHDAAGGLLYDFLRSVDFYADAANA